MKRMHEKASRSRAGLRWRVAVCAAALAGLALAACMTHAMAMTDGNQGDSWALEEGCAAVACVERAYADDSVSTDASNAESSVSPSATSNKPEASASPSGSVAQVDEMESNVINGSQLPDSSFLYDTSIAALTGADSYFDNQTVQVTGEAVGDSIRSGFDKTHRWITLASTAVDENEALAVYMSEDFAQLVDGFGKYGQTGTVLQVRGTFHLACSEHDGVTDLHAENVSVVKVSERHPDTLEWGLFIPGLVLVIFGLAAMAVYSFARERSR